MYFENREDAEDYIGREVAELFAEYDNGLYVSIDNAEFSSSFSSFSIYEKNDAQLLSSIPEILCSWYADENGKYKNIDDFLKSNRLENFLTARDFTAVINSKALLPASFLPLLQRKLPFNIGLKRLEDINRQHYIQSKKARPLIMNTKLIVKEIQRIQQERKAKREAELKAYREAYAKKYAERIKAYRKKYYQEHKTENSERCKQYYQVPEHRHKAIESARQWAAQNPEKRKEIKLRYLRKNPDYHKNYREQNRDRVLMGKQLSHLKKRYAENPDETLLQKIQFMEANLDNASEYRRQYEAEVEARKAQTKINIANYRKKQKSKIRFKKKTGIKILALLQGIIAARS